jgi:hypothetical protein
MILHPSHGAYSMISDHQALEIPERILRQIDDDNTVKTPFYNKHMKPKPS